MTDPTGVGREPQVDVRFAAVRQRWTSVAFIHWPFLAGTIQPLLPDGLTVATHDGSAWVSLVAFCVSSTRGPVPMPSLPPFHETNLRTYVRTDDGCDGLWFLTLEAGSRATVAGGRTVYGVPYHLARGSIELAGGEVRSRSRRRRGGAGHDLTVEAGPAADRTSLDDWLTGRWRAFAVRSGLVVETMLQHEPWPLRRGRLISLDEDLLASVGLARPTAMPVVHVADEIAEARLSLPRPARGRRARPASPRASDGTASPVEAR